PSTTSVQSPGGDIVITALGHASVQFERSGTVVIVDPVTNFADLSKAKPADLILVTDIHPDHFDPAAITKLRKPRAPVVLTPAAMELQKIPDAIVMSNRQIRTNEPAPPGITVSAVPPSNPHHGPPPGRFYHPKNP